MTNRDHIIVNVDDDVPESRNGAVVKFQDCEFVKEEDVITRAYDSAKTKESPKGMITDSNADPLVKMVADFQLVLEGMVFVYENHQKSGKDLVSTIDLYERSKNYSALKEGVQRFFNATCLNMKYHPTDLLADLKELEKEAYRSSERERINVNGSCLKRWVGYGLFFFSAFWVYYGQEIAKDMFDEKYVSKFPVMSIVGFFIAYMGSNYMELESRKMAFKSIVYTAASLHKHFKKFVELEEIERLDVIVPLMQNYEYELSSVSKILVLKHTIKEGVEDFIPRQLNRIMDSNSHVCEQAKAVDKYKFRLSSGEGFWINVKEVLLDYISSIRSYAV